MKNYLSLTLLSGVLLAPTLSAQLLFEETFPLGSGPGLYETGDVIGQPGADGNWSGSSRLGGGGIQVPGTTGNHGFFPGQDPSNFGVQSGGISYPGLIGGNARLSGGTFLLSNGNAAGNQGVERQASGFPTAAENTGTYFFSLTAQAPSMGSLGADEFIGGGFSGSGTTSPFGFSFGFQGDNIVLHGRGFVTGGAGSGAERNFVQFDDGSGNPVSYTPGENYFLVLEYNSNDRTISAMLNPDLTGTGSLGTWSGGSTMTSVGGTTHLTGIDLRSITTTTDENNLTFASFGDFRIGTDLESVTPIPEPSTYALFAGALAIGLLIRRRMTKNKA